MLSIKEFQKFKIFSSHTILGGVSGSSGSGQCNTACDGGTSDCSTYTYTDDCDGGNRVITSESSVPGDCEFE